MLELGDLGPRLHAELGQTLAENNIDLVYCAGPLSRALWEALPPNRRGGYSETAAALEHPHIAPTYDAWREPGRAYIVGRYLRGGQRHGAELR